MKARFFDGSLEVGPYEAGWHRREEIDLWVGCAVECPLPFGDRQFAKVGMAYFPLEDVLVDWGSPDGRRMAADVEQAAAIVAHGLRQELRVLVTCHMGLNRSGLVAARALVLLGMVPQRAVGAIRRMRGPDALSNPSFLQYLQG